MSPPSRPRIKLLLAALLAALSILLPLTPVWRHTGQEMDALVAERALLDPLSRAIALQRSLLGHADVAERVLRGRGGLEAERRLRQHAVEADLVALQATLSAGLWARALGEAHALAQDWRQLSWQVAQRSIDAAQCARGHQLLVEQAVQVMDLVSSQAPAGSALRLALHGQPPARLEAVVFERQLAVQRQLAEAEQARALTLAGALGAVLLLAPWLRRVATPSVPPPPAGGDVRRSHGRRRTDFSGFDPTSQWNLGPGAPDRRDTAAGRTPTGAG